MPSPQAADTNQRNDLKDYRYYYLIDRKENERDRIINTRDFKRKTKMVLSFFLNEKELDDLNLQ